MSQGREFPGGAVVRTLRFHCRVPGFNAEGMGSIPGWGTEILQALRGQNKNKNKGDREI